MNTMIITHMPHGKFKQISISDCAPIIPRLGEEVFFDSFYLKVTNVTYDFEDGIVWIRVENV